MSEMKDSGIEWIGKIPTRWGVIPFKTCMTERQEKNNPVVSEERLSLSIESGVTLYSEKTTNLDRFKDDFSQYKIAHVGDLVLNSMNMIVGATGISRYYGCVSPAYYTFFDNELDHITAQYFDFIFHTKPLLRYLFSIGKGIYAIERGDDRVNTCRLKISRDDLRSMKVPFPPVNEQRAIVSFLHSKCSDIENIIGKSRNSIEEYKKLKQSVITEAVTNGIRGKRPQKDSGSAWFGNIPDTWDTNKLKYTFTIRKRIVGEDGHTVLAITQKGVKPKDMSNGNGQFAESYANYQIVHPGDFAMNHMDLLTGWVDISKFEGVTSPDYRVFTLNDTIKNCPGYYLYMMQMCYSNRIFYSMGQGVSGMGRWRLPADMFNNFIIACPPFEEQQEIAEFLDKKCAEIDCLIESKEKFIKELESYKKSLIYEYVTGKKEVEV